MNATPATPNSDYNHGRNQMAVAGNWVNTNSSMLSSSVEEDAASPLSEIYHRRVFKGKENVSRDDDIVTLDSEEEENYWILRRMLCEGIRWTQALAELTSLASSASRPRRSTSISMDKGRSEDEQVDSHLEQQFSPLVPWRMAADADSLSDEVDHPRNGVPRCIQFVSVLDYEGDVEDNEEESSTGTDHDVDFDSFNEVDQDGKQNTAPFDSINVPGGILSWLSPRVNIPRLEDVLQEGSTAARRIDRLPVTPDGNPLADFFSWPFPCSSEEDESQVTGPLDLVMPYDPLNGHHGRDSEIWYT